MDLFMGKFIVRRFIQAVLVLLGVSFIVFALLYLSGDPVSVLLPPDATIDQINDLRQKLGFNDPFLVQYGRFLLHALTGDLGQSLFYNQPATSIVFDRLPATIQLAVAAFIVSLLIAFPIGVLSAAKRNSIFDRVGMVFALIGQSVPVFWLGILMILIFAVNLHWLPTSGYGEFKNIIMPAIALGLFTTARTTRLVRSTMIEVLNQEYIRTAQAKGLRQLTMLRRHALKNALIPIVTVLGLDFATLLGGAVITETIFAWPGIGQLAIDSIGRHDYPVVQGVVLIVAFGYVLINFLVDLLYAYLNPRIRFS
jgi:ABC-type dipeptide/oligopeptide/nickel transport system permease component